MLKGIIKIRTDVAVMFAVCGNKGEFSMILLKETMDRLFQQIGYTRREKYDDTELNRLFNYWLFLEENAMLVQELTGETLKTVLYSRYYWSSRFIENYMNLYGMDAGLEQERYKILEEMEDDMSKIKLGSHVGMAGKDMFLASVKEAESYGANVLMLYTGAPQNTRRKEIEELNIDKGWEYAKKAGIEEIVVHAPYIINLGNTVKPETFELATEFLKKEIERTAAMRSKILVLHPGSHVNAGVEAGIAQVVKGLNLVLDENNDDVLIALETMAEKGSELGRTFEELKMIYDGVNKKDRLRVCFDTCHVNDAGYDIVQNYEGVLQEFDKIIGLEQIAVIHVNDSLNPCGAHKDRHANIGKGFIGFETLNKIVHDERFADVPKILETPWLCEEGSEKKTIPLYKEEIAKLLGE